MKEKSLADVCFIMGNGGQVVNGGQGSAYSGRRRAAVPST